MDWKILIEMAAVAVLSATAGAVVIYLLLSKKMGAQISSAEQSAQQMRDEAQREADNIRKAAELEAKEEVFQRTKQFEKDNQRRRVELEKIENRFKNKERALDQKVELYERREKSLADKERTLDA